MEFLFNIKHSVYVFWIVSDQFISQVQEVTQVTFTNSK